MQEQQLIIKGMTCNRCINAVRNQVSRLELEIIQLRLGELVVRSCGEELDLAKINSELQQLGFELVEDRKTRLSSGIKELVARVYSGDFDFPTRFRFSALVEKELFKDYDIVSAAFSETEGITLEQYIIKYRIERVKSMLLEERKSLSDIAFRLGYSSVAHLSRQFKSVVGMNPSVYRDNQQANSVMI